MSRQRNVWSGQICSDAVEILIRWADSGGGPYCVPCPDCEWREGDGQFSRIGEDLDRPVCPRCSGTGSVECASLSESPWVIDDHTIAVANLHLFWADKYIVEAAE